MNRFDEFESVCTLIRIAKEQHNYGNNYVKTIIRDAKIVKYHPDKIRTIARSTYRFSVKLGRSDVGFLEKMSPEHLTEKDFITLLSFFENL